MPYYRTVDKDGFPIIQVRPFDGNDNRRYAYAWVGSRLPQIGDSFTLVVSGVPWEVVVVAHGTEYSGDITQIGGEKGLKYDLSGRNW